MNSDQHFALVIILFFGGVMPFGLAWLIPTVKARMKRLDAEAAALNGAADPRLYDEMDALRTRVAELEERLDFTERMLAQQQDHARLTEGK
jgi:predicted nuclease with TOPRIM domain